MSLDRHARIALAAISAVCSAPLHATGAPAIAEGEVHQVSEAELAHLRGGFAWGGLNIEFGAEIRSYLNGALVMQTNVSWTNPPSPTQAAVPAGTPASLQTILLATGSPALNLNNAKVLLANQGQTAFIQRTNGAVQNILLNTASNVDLRQQVDLQLDVGGYAPFLSSILAARVGASLPTAGVLGIMR